MANSSNKDPILAAPLLTTDSEQLRKLRVERHQLPTAPAFAGIKTEPEAGADRATRGGTRQTNLMRMAIGLDEYGRWRARME